MTISLTEDYSYIIPKNDKLPKNSFSFRNHKINLFYLQCSCKDYRENVKKYPKRDLRRICKHIYFKLYSDFSEELDPLTKFFLDIKFWYGVTCLTKVDFETNTSYMGINLGKKMIAAIIKEENHWQKFFYSLSGSYWIGEKPALYEIFESIFKEVFINTS